MKIRTEFTEEELEKYPELSNEDNLFALKHILNRINDGKNAIVLTVGVTGSGKSWVNLRMAELLMVIQGKIFDTANRTFFKLKTFLAYTNLKDVSPGDVSVSEELGVSMGSRQWQKNVDYSQLLQTFRDLGLVSFLNVPFKTMIDKHARLLSHFQIEMMGRKASQNVIKMFILQHNPSASSESKTTYRKYLRVLKTNEWGFRKMKPIKKLYWNKPSKDVLDIYLPMQSQFKSEIRLGLEVRAKKSSEEDVKTTRIGKITDEDVERLTLKGLTIKEMASLLAVSEATIFRHKAHIKIITQNRQDSEHIKTVKV